MLLAGSLSEYPLFLLLEIFLHRRETGLLEVSSPKQSGYFFIKNGEIKGGEVGKLRGGAAVDLAGSFADASFQFKPLEPTDYARVVWEKSFGPNRLVADSPDIRVEAFRTILVQFLSYAEAACDSLGRAAVPMAQQLLRQVLFYASVAYRTLHKRSVAILRGTVAYARAAYDFCKRAQVRRKLLTGLRNVIAESQIVLRGYNAKRRKATILKDAQPSSFQGALTPARKRAAMLPSFQEVAQSNISFGVIIVALVVGTAVIISQILRINVDQVDTVAPTAEKDENIGTPSQAQPGPGSRERARRKPRIGSQTPTEKKRDTSRGQNSRFLPQSATVLAPRNAAQAPRNSASDSDVSKKQPATTSGVQTIPVVLQIENGRVSQASLLKHRTGMERYEAAALRIARQRRYPTAGKHTETVVVKVDQPNPN